MKREFNFKFLWVGKAGNIKLRKEENSKVYVISCDEDLEKLKVKKMSDSNVKGALFICLGNICRSPIAAAVFKHVAQEKGVGDRWHIESAALGSWHVGNPADRRAQKTLKSHNISPDHRARQITKEDFNKFDFIFGMDEENMSALKRMAPSGSKATLYLLGSFDPTGDRIIRDPYYDDNDAGFEKCYQQCLRSSTAFIDQNNS